ncbi:hypothetical protein Tco_1107957 [Tanacetum coccineum]
MTNLTDMLSKFVNSNTASTSGSGTLPSNYTYDPEVERESEMLDYYAKILLSTLKALIGNKEKLSEMARTPLNEHCSAVILNKLPKKLGDPVVDFDADPRVPLILGRSFLNIGCALIDVYEGELTFRVRKEAVTFNLDLTSRYSSNYDDMTANRIDVIEMACE